MFKVDNINNEAILRDFLQKWKVECRADGLVPMCCAIFPLHLSQVLCLPRGVMPGHTKCCTCHARSSQQAWRSDAPKCNPSQEISARTSQQLWWTCLLYCACHGKCIFVDPLQMSHACHRFWTCYKTLTFLLTFDKVHNPMRLPRETTSERQKVVRACGVFNILTSRCASRHNTVHLFDIATSKSAPELKCFVHFYFDMCFVPQGRALFRRRNF